MEAIQTAITALEQELEVTQARCGELETAIGAMRKLLPASPNGARKTAGKSKRTDGRTEQTAGQRRARANGDRSLPEHLLEMGDRVIIALKKENPQAPGALVKAAKLKFSTPFAARQFFIKLAEAGRVVRKGFGRGAVVGLPGKPGRGEL